MNSKRQTIWLVSMLSLMVVLSAYYLFTEDASKLESATDAGQIEEIKVDSIVETPDDLTDTTDATTQEDTVAAEEESKTSSAAADDKLTNDKLTDEAILEKVEQQGKSSEDYFIAQQLKRNDNLAKQTEGLMKIITDSNQNTEAVSKAYDDLDKIQTRTAKLNDIEDELSRDFPNVIVSEAANKWKVVLQDDKLESSQAVSIIDLVMKELNIGAENISIQVMP